MSTRLRRRHRQRVRGWMHAKVSAALSMGARAERMLAARLVELERHLDRVETKDESAVWAEYYVALDLWLRVRAKDAATPTPSLTQAMLKDRFQSRARTPSPVP